MKRIAIALAATALALGMLGCPSSSTQRKAAQAADIAAASVSGFQQAEIVAHSQGLIPDDDHLFIEQSLLTLGRAGKATDTCISGALTNSGILVCVNISLNTVNQLQADGALHLKSAKAKNDFALTMTGVQAALNTITALLGGK
jgi:hypothetical protein